MLGVASNDVLNGDLRGTPPPASRGTQVEGLSRPEKGSKNKGSGEAVHDGWLLLVELSGGRGRGEWVGVGHEVRGVCRDKEGREGEAVCER